MELSVAHTLADATSAFYRANAESFSLTRQTAWPGWERIANDAGIAGRDELRALDVACGNLRFESYLARSWPAVAYSFRAVDNCEALVGAGAPRVAFTRVDVVSALLDDERSGADSEASSPFGEAGGERFDLAVCFGFMHHVPTFGARARLLKGLVASLAPDGYAAVSFWRFMESERLAAKVRAATPLALDQLGLRAGDLDDNDYLLGWQDERTTWRYCHHFSEDEVERLAQAADARIVDEFRADGRTGALNEYLVLQRKDSRG